MTKIIDPLQVVADLEPAMLSQLADDSYARRRHDDLARTIAEGAPRSPAAPGLRHRSRLAHARPRWQLLTGGVAITAAAAVAAVALTGAPPASRTRSHGTAGPGALPHATLDARSFLLSSATVSAQASVAAGTYWYIKERDFEPTAPKSKATKSAATPAATENFGATFAATEESWFGPASARTIVDEDLKFTFASVADEARWKAAGEPKLASAAGFGNTGPVTTNYAMSFHWGVGKGLSLAGIKGLPTTPAALDKVLRRMWNSEPDKAAAVGFPDPTFGQYLVQWADVLLTGPASPGTRAAIYQLLAAQPGITTVNSVTDPLGRSGVAVADGGGDYLLIDPHTAQLLAYTANRVYPNTAIPATGGVEVYEATGWTSQLGVQP